MTIQASLINWGNWARIYPHYGHCYSIESRYRSPQHWNPPEPRIIVDIPAALAIERAVRNLPLRHHTGLACQFVYRLSQRQCCQIVTMRFDQWPEFLDSAQIMLTNILTFQNGLSTLHPNSRKPMLQVEIRTFRGAVAL